MVPMGTMSSESAVSDDLKDIRSRILGAAFDSFVEHGYAETTTIEIATRAKVSKRELYALVLLPPLSVVAVGRVAPSPVTS